MPKKVSRSTVNEQQYSAPEFTKSGFNLSHRRYGSYLIGRTQCSGFQWLMPGDKISGKNDGNFTMKSIVTPMVSPLEVSQYNIFLPFRAIDRTFERAMAPSKNNNMSQSWSVPTVNTSSLVKDILTTYGLIGLGSSSPAKKFLDKCLDYINTGFSNTKTIGDVFTDTSTTASSAIYSSTGCVGIALTSLRSGGAFYLMADKMYLADALKDIIEKIIADLGTSINPLSSSTTVAEFFYLFIDALLTPFIGRYSYYADFKFKYLRPADIYKFTHESIWVHNPTIDNLYLDFDDTPLCEYPLRVMYAIWYERFRNVDIEPVNSNLPDWRDFGSTSIFDLANGGNLCYLLYRIRDWYDDMFMTAQVDDLSRHVYAPVYGSLSPDITEAVNSDGDTVSVLGEDTYLITNGSVDYHVQTPNNLDTQANFGGTYGVNSQKPANISLHWRDQLSGTTRHLSCPIPTNINDILSSNDLSSVAVFGLDLNTLRQTQQLERYLKRNYLFGDEYQDRMMAHYNSRVSDNRINRPEVISTSLNNADFGQEIANMSNGISKAGDRTATGTLHASGDQYTMFAEEFGLLVHLVSFMPLASYDGTCPQLLINKQIDWPLPEFATNNEEFGRKLEIADTCFRPPFTPGDPRPQEYMFGRYPAYHAWRQRVDEVSGEFLNELQNCTFRRFWGLGSSDGTPKLNYQFIHCRPNLGMFANTVLYDSQIYGDIIHECYVERVLPTPVEVI